MKNSRTGYRLSAICASMISLFLFAACNQNKSDLPNTASNDTSVGREIDDGVVTAKVKSALLADSDVKSIDLKTETHKGVVQLSGFVDNQAQADRAVAITRGIDGVKAVENKVNVKGAGSTVAGKKVDDSTITAEVKAALSSDASSKGLTVNAVTHQGVVQLSGFVDSPSQITQVVNIARKVDGVRDVQNQLNVKNNSANTSSQTSNK